MWTEGTSEAGTAGAQGKALPNDLTDAEWQAIEPLLPRPSATRRHRVTDLREVMNAIRYLVRSGCQWRMVPVHFPPLGRRCTGGSGGLCADYCSR